MIVLVIRVNSTTNEKRTLAKERLVPIERSVVPVLIIIVIQIGSTTDKKERELLPIERRLVPNVIVVVLQIGSTTNKKKRELLSRERLVPLTSPPIAIKRRLPSRLAPPPIKVKRNAVNSREDLCQ